MPLNAEQSQRLERLEQKVDLILEALGIVGGVRSRGEIEQEAKNIVLQFEARRSKKRDHERTAGSGNT
jgi:hypothetical protein